MREPDPTARRSSAEFALGVHNLREPLRMIRCYAALLGDPAEDPAHCAAQIEAGAVRLEALLEGMFSCFQLPDLFRPERTNMNLVAGNAITRLSPEQREAIAVAPLPHVRGDFEMLTEVLSRLLDNAFKYGGPPIQLSAAPDGREGHWRFQLDDHGEGIDEGDVERCFGMFQRLGRRDVPGEGFGLTYCRRAIELHGGRIWIESPPGAGTSVIFTLPEPGEPAGG